MSGHLAQVPLWAASAVALLVLLGSGLTLLGTIGLMRLTTFFDRIHAPTLGTSWGTLSVMLASALMFTVTGGRPVLHELVIGVLIMATTPVTMMILARAALFRGEQSRAVRGAGAAEPEAAPARPAPSAAPGRRPA